MNSIKSNLYLYLISSILVLWLFLIYLTLVSFRSYYRDTVDSELTDEAQENAVFLREIIDILPHTRFSDGASSVVHEFNLPSIIQVYRKGIMVAQSTGAPSFPQPEYEGFIDVNTSGQKWRVYYQYENEYESWIIVGKPHSEISEAMYALLPKIIWPIFLVLPMIFLCVLFSVRSALHSMNKIASEIRLRDEDATHPICTADAPQEILPIITSLNDLLTRLNTLISRERHFTDLAAHELRTPLTALKTEVQIAQAGIGGQPSGEVYQRLITRVDVAARLIKQLLDLTRVNSYSMHKSAEIVNLWRLSAEVVAEVADSALDRNIDIELVDEVAAEMSGDRGLLLILFRNIIDNAIKYSCAPGKISIGIYDNQNSISVVVEDEGKGVDESLLESILEPFVRETGNQVAGSGLGLSIVKRIVDLHQASVTIANRQNFSGLRVSLDFPKENLHQSFR